MSEIRDAADPPSPRILFGYATYPNKLNPDLENSTREYLRRLRSSEFHVDGFCLSLNPPSHHLHWRDLDSRWKRGELSLMRHYEALEKALAGYDVLLNASGINLHPRFVEQLDAFTVFRCFDDPENSHNLSRPVASAYDLCLVGNAAEVETYRRWGARHAFWTPIGFGPEMANPDLTYEKILSEERDADLFMIIDRLSPWRKKLMDAMLRAFPGAHFYGRGWPRGYLPVNREKEFLRKARIGPNFHNSTGPINSRTFYLPANGVLQICDNKSHLGDIYKLGEEVVGFDTVGECIDLCRYYLAHEEERRRIAANGWKRAVTEYNEIAVFHREVSLIESLRQPKPKSPSREHIALNQIEKTAFRRALHPPLATLLSPFHQAHKAYRKVRGWGGIIRRHMDPVLRKASRPVSSPFVLVLDSFEWGGAERQALLLAKGLAEKGFLIEVLSLGTGAAESRFREAGIRSNMLARPKKLDGKKPALPAKLLFFVRLFAALWRMKPACLLPFTYHPNLICCLLWRITPARSCYWNQRDLDPRMPRGPIQTLGVRLASGIFANSPHATEFLCRNFRLPLEKVRVILNGCALTPPTETRRQYRARLDLSEDTFLVCMPANISANKDHRTLLEAWRIFIAGIGPERNCALVLAGRADLPLEPLAAGVLGPDWRTSVFPIGSVDDISSLLHACDLAAFSSPSEGCSNAVLECGLAGLALVGTDVPGIRMAVSKENHRYLTAPASSEAMATCLADLYRDPEKRAEIGSANRNHVEKQFSVPTMVGAFQSHLFPLSS